MNARFAFLAVLAAAVLFAAASARAADPATAPPLRFKLELTSDIKAGASLWGSHDPNVRKSGEIVALNFEVKARAERAFYEALVTEIGMPAMDGASKAPATITFSTPKVTPAKR